MKKTKTGHARGIILSKMIREYLIGKVQFDQKLEGGEVNNMNIWGKNIPDRGNSKGKTLRWECTW